MNGSFCGSIIGSIMISCSMNGSFCGSTIVTSVNCSSCGFTNGYISSSTIGSWLHQPVIPWTASLVVQSNYGWITHDPSWEASCSSLYDEFYLLWFPLHNTAIGHSLSSTSKSRKRSWLMFVQRSYMQLGCALQNTSEATCAI